MLTPRCSRGGVAVATFGIEHGGTERTELNLCETNVYTI